MRVVRIYHAGRDPAHRARERALLHAGVDVTLVVPRSWPGADSGLTGEPFDVVELDVARPGDVNRHRWRGDLAGLLTRLAPDLVDVHEEPVSVAARQWVAAAGSRPVVMYSAQNLDKRWPPPFAGYERSALDRVTAFYPCSRQAASVLRGKGFGGPIEVLPLGVDQQTFRRGEQSVPVQQVVLLMAGRLVPEKGVLDALAVLSAVRARCPVRLLVVGSGPQQSALRRRAAELGVDHLVEWQPWVRVERLAELYRQAHVALLPSRATSTWVEQFGRVVVEAWSSGAVPVGYASGSLTEVVGESGVVVPEGDADALAGAVLDLVTRPGEWQRRRSTAPAALATWDQVAARQVELYEVAVRGRSAVRRAGRPAARLEFGSPARTTVSDRPFALPVLRSSKAFHRLAQRRAAARS